MAIKFLSGQTISGTLTVSGNVQGATFNGLAINTTGVNNLANQIVRTQANGYVNFGWINSVSGNHTGSITRITASNDAYLRYVTPAQFRTGVTDGYYAPVSTVSGVTSVATTNGITGGTIISTGTIQVDNTVIRTTGNQSITGNTTFYPSGTGTGYSTAAIELMSSSSGLTGTPPRIGFHWGGVVASNIAIESNGTIVIRDNPGTGYEDFKALNITATGVVYASGGNSGTWNSHTSNTGTVTSVTGTGSVSGLTLTGTVTSTGNITLGGAISGFTELNMIRSLGTTAFTNGTNPNITTAQVMAEIEADGGFDSYSSVFKTSWSYAGNYNLTDAGDFTETAGSSWITWTDNSSDTTRGNITTLAIAPNTGSSAGGVFIYNDQGSGYAPGWRQVWTSTTDGSGSGLDADLLDAQQGSYYLDWNNFTNKPTIPSVGNGQIDGRTSGLGISGSMDATANQTGNTTFTVTSNAATAATASTIAYRDSAADINVRLLRANYQDQGTISGAIAFRVNNSSDNYTRYCSSPSAIRTFLGAAPSTGGSYLPLAGGTMTGTITMGTQNFAVAANYGRGVFGLYSSTRYQHLWSMGTAYKLPDDGTTTGNLYGVAWSYPSAGGAAANLSDHGMLIINNGIYRAAISNSIRCVTDMRTPIYYDSNNTAYFGDFASYSSMRGVAIRGDLGASDIDNQIFFYGTGGTTTSAIGFKNGGQFANPTGNGDGWNTMLTMDTDGRGWVFRRGTGGANFTSAYTAGWILNNGIFQANASMRAPIFYDSNNTAYYGDFGGTYSNITKLKINANWGSASGVSPDDAQIQIRGSYPSITFRSTNSNKMWLRHMDSAGQIQHYYAPGTDSTSWSIKHTMQIDGTFSSSASHRAPIFYDSANTAYYGDFAGNSNINTLTSSGAVLIGGVFANNPYNSVTGSRLMFGGDGGTTYYIGTNLENYGGNYNKLDIRWHTGIRMGAQPSYGGIRFYDTEALGTEIFAIGKSGNYVQAANSLRAPIFYDSNNTAYYGDFASTSQLNVLNCAGTLTVTGAGGVVAPKFTDYNNGSFYLDPASTGTSLNVAGDVVAYASSDIRFKNNITPITNALDKINKIGGYTFEWNEKSHKETGKKDIGVIAQEVEEILPEIVDTRDNGYKAVDYSKLTALLIQSVKEQQVIIDNLKSRIETLENN